MQEFALTPLAQHYSLLLDKGLIRISLPVPEGAEFSVVAINNPYACPETTSTRLSLYCRPRPASNLRFVPALMWDGREPDLKAQASNATLVHAQPAQPQKHAQLQRIVDFEDSLFTAQSENNLAGNLNTQGARGGPIFLSQQDFDQGSNPDGLNVFTLYSTWESLDGSGSSVAGACAAIARGEILFNNRPMRISAVAGFNEFRGQLVVVGTCGTCHNTPNVGGNSGFGMMDIGTSSPKPDFPTYRLLCIDNKQVVTSDPGRALITGKYADISKVKIPGLRGLAARAPYFHNGNAATLMEVINFYDQRFGMLLHENEKADLVAFLSSL